MVEESYVREIALRAIFTLDSLLRAETLDADEDLRVDDAVVPAFEPGVERHEAWERLVLLVLERDVADAVCAAGGMDHDMVGCDATREHVSADDDGADDFADDFGGVGDEERPKGKQLTKLERVLIARKVQLDL